MDLEEQLWLLKQIYSSNSSYYDEGRGMHLHRISSKFPTEDLEKLRLCDHYPNQMIMPNHDEILSELLRLAATWTLLEAANAFVAGLWSAPFLWQSALTAKLIARSMPPHKHTPYKGSSQVCTVCGFHDQAVDVTQSWYSGMTGGTPLDGEPVGHVLALKEMERMEKRPTPTEYDIWNFRAILTVIRAMPPKSRYSKVRDTLHKEGLLPTSKKWVYGSLLETLALIGVLDTQEYPGMAVRFTTYQKRDERPSVRVEPQAPLAWWDSSVGINEAVMREVFPFIDCTMIPLTDRPEAIPPLSQTVTGQLEKRKLPRQASPKSPDAGKGPVEAGDVYAVCVRDDAWVTVYCYEVQGTYTMVEFLDGFFTEMPMKSQLKSTIRTRWGERWKMRASRIDKTTGVRRVARNIPVPATALDEPDRIRHGGARELKFLARACFPELDLE